MKITIFVLSFIFLNLQVFGQIDLEQLENASWLRRTGNDIQSLELIERVIHDNLRENNLLNYSLALLEKSNWNFYYMEYDTALALAQKALNIVEQEQFDYLVAPMQFQCGRMSLKIFDFDTALNYLESAKNSALQNNQKSIYAGSEAYIKDALEIYYFSNNKTYNSDNVKPFIKKAIEEFKIKKDTAKILQLHCRLMDIERGQGNFDQVEKMLKELKQILNKYPNNRILASYNSFYAIYYDQKGNKNLSHKYLNQALKIAKKENLQPLVQHYYIRFYEYYKEEKQYDQALAVLDTLVPLASECIASL